jgi:hypothetical protein
MLYINNMRQEEKPRHLNSLLWFNSNLVAIKGSRILRPGGFAEADRVVKYYSF